MPRLKWKRSRFIAESCCAVIAHQYRFRSEKKQIEIVIMVVIEPDGAFVGAAGERDGGFRKYAALIDVERRSRLRNHGKIRQAVIIKIAGSNGNNSFQVAQTGIGH